MAMVVEWGMTPCTSKTRLISLYIKYLGVLLMQPGLIEMILKVGFLLGKNRVLEMLLTCN
jgi:hypothetical protein